MRRNFKNAAIAVAVLFFVGPTYAQVCMESSGTSGSGKANLDCDMRYRDMVVTCDKKNPEDIVGTRPACPKEPMPMIDTPKRSYVDGYNPYLFVSPRDAKDATLPYTGPYSVGTPGDTSKTFQMIGKSAKDVKRLAACTAQIKGTSDPQNPAEAAKLTRLQMDACTNEYILNAAVYPYQKANVRLLSLDDPENPGAVMNLDGECQPLRTFRETENEYPASTYLEAAWKKTLQDPKYRKTTPSSMACVPCVDDSLPCDREPHLPCGTTIETPAKPANELKDPPEPFPEVLLSSIATIPHEEIVDPTHPFSPRWDFRATDRDYSTVKGAAKATAMGATKAAAIYGSLQIYMSKTDNTIFCAGVKEAKAETDKEKKANLEVPVDVLEFRRPAFEDAISARTLYNSACYAHKNPFVSGQDALFIVAPASYCYNITGFSMFYPWIYARGKDCWKCFGLNGKVDDETQHPPCTLNYLGVDLKIKGSLPGGLNLFSRTAQCNYPLMKRDSKYNMDKVCRDLRKPFTPLNKLKMRYHNPKDKDDTEGENVVLKKGALEGLTFREYFGNHMPYPRLWDKGTSLQLTNSADGNDQPPLDTTGQYSAIVGVGREAAAKAALGSGEDAKEKEDAFSDQRCKAMGWIGSGSSSVGVNPGATPSVSLPTTNALIAQAAVPVPIKFAGLTLYAPDPLTSWAEFKLYQTRTLRNIGISCIGRYEKVFKPGSAENMMLLGAGADWSPVVISKCTHAQEASGPLRDCKTMTLKEYEDAGTPESDDTTVYMKQLVNTAWPNSWRGYLAAEKSNVKFPNFGGGSAIGVTGLDKAELGDIVMMPNGPSNKTDATQRGLAKLALVIETNVPSSSDCEDKKNCYIKVVEPDNGKLPDVCGTTDTWGEMKTRYYFKPDHLPKDAVEEYKQIMPNGADSATFSDCLNNGISHCTMNAWSTIKIYRMRNDVREGCDKDKAIDCKEGGK